MKTQNPHNILRTNDFDASKLVITESTRTKYGGLQSFINYPHKGTPNGKVIYQTPKMTVPFGIVKSQMKEDDEPKYYLELSFNATTDRLEGLHQKTRALFASIDDKLVDVAVERSAEWFKKKKDRGVIIDEKYKSSLRYSTDEEGNPKYEFPDRLNFKILVHDDGKPAVEVYNTQRERLTVNSIDELMKLITPKSRVKAIVQAACVWITATGCGISWRVLQIKVYPNEQMPDYAFQDSDEVETLE